MIAAGLVVFSLVVAALLVAVDREIRQKGEVLGPVEHWGIKIHGSGNREHIMDHMCTYTAKGCEALSPPIASFQRFCVDGPDPFYEGMTVDLYFQRYEKCWKIVNYTIRRDAYGNPTEANQAAR